MSKKNQKVQMKSIESQEEMSAEDIPFQGDNSEESVSQEPSKEPSNPEDLAAFVAKRKQLVIDLKNARKDDEGHEFAKKLEKELEDLDAKITSLKESDLKKQEKAAHKELIGKPVNLALSNKIISPKPAGGISDSQIPEMFKLKIKAPTSVAFDLVKICDILGEAAYDLYFAHNGSSPKIQEAIKILAKLNEELCEELMKDELERIKKEQEK